MSASPVNPGDILVGRYRVDRVLGMGNMGIVVAATHVHLGHRVALKFMLANRGGAKELHDRFLREARAAIALKTEHVAHVSEFGYLDNGAPYMVMEFLEGQDLAAVLQERGPLPIPEAVDYILQACEAVGEAHAAGIIHRDIKPANLFLTHGFGKALCVKVLDFGISKFTEAEHALTKTDQAIGSPLYMSREQMNSSKDVDGRADIWSLSVTLYEMIAGPGKTPFHAETLPKLCTRVCLDAPTPLLAHRPDAPPGLQEVLVQAVEKERERRFRNVGEFAAALAPFGSPRAAAYVERIAQALGEAVAPARPTDLLPLEPSTQTTPESLALHAPAHSGVVGSAPAAATTGSALIRPAGAAASRRRRGPLLAVGAGLVVALSVVGVVRWRTGSTSPAAAPDTPASVDAPSSTPAAVSVEPPPPPVVLPTVAPTTAPSATVTAASAKVPPQKGPTPSAPILRLPGQVQPASASPLSGRK